MIEGISLVSVKVATLFTGAINRGAPATVTFRIDLGSTSFDIGIPVDGRLDDGDMVAAARHALHANFAALAERTGHWSLTQQWFDERLPAPPPTPEFDDSLF